MLLFPFGTTHTKQYGPIEFDHADAVEVMHNYRQRGVRLAWDVEHAYQLGGPEAFQVSHGWSGLFVDQEGLKASADWNQNGEARLSAREFIYDSPAIQRWRGNHVRAVEMLSLVKEPARNGSIPLLMTGGSMTTATSTPTPRQAMLSKMGAGLGAFLALFEEPGLDPDIKALGEEMAGRIKDPATKMNALLQESGGATGAASDSQPAQQPTVVMSGSGAAKPDPLAELGAEFMTLLGAKTTDEARGVLRALKENQTALLSARAQLSSTLVQLGLHQAKVRPDEVKELEQKTPEYVTALLSGRSAFANTAAAQPAIKQDPKTTEASVDDDVSAQIEDEMNRTKISRGGK